MFLALRIVHIITGVFWAGSVFFLISFLQPALRDVALLLALLAAIASAALVQLLRRSRHE